MPWFLQAVFLTSCGALAGSLAGVALLFFRRPGLAHRVAKRATLMAALVLAIAVVEVQVLWTAPGVVAPLVVRALPPGDPSVKARALAEGISTIMNCAGLTVPAMLLGGIAWIVARRQSKR